ncbi:MAG TPA: FecR domain-containing protein [Candidatus Acidoferrum sp.]|nr:FecR domain-containing protein [Candidatus Acidoferrum sp.]
MSPHTPYDPNHPKINRVEVYWHTVTYKTVAVYVILIAAIIFAALYLIDPNLYTAAYEKLNKSIGNGDSDAPPISLTQAKFVNLDGKVQVKKVNSVQWVDADFRTTLDKGDQIQTSADGAARITFADGTTYTVKSGTFITVEENSMGRERPSSSGVRINTGQVDLRTPNWSSPDSKAAVSVEDSVAQVHSNSHAAVKADPDHKQNEIVVSSGSAELQRGQEKVEIGQYQKAVIPTGGPITKSDVLAPPDLTLPRNFEPLIVENPREASIHFEWKPVSQAVSYTLRVSATAMFTKTVKDIPGISGTSAEVSGLDAGDYFWTVTASDAKKQTSEVSETFRFTLVAQGKTQEMMLEITGTQIHGRVAEIIGKTEPGAALIVNGQPVPIIAADGTFRHFTEPLEPGQHTIVIIGENRRGGTAEKKVSIVVPR